MRPSQYHYIKRMWTRYLYKKDLRKKKHSGIFLTIFKWMMILAFFPFALVVLIFMAISKTIGIKRFLKFCGIAFAALAVLSVIHYAINNFFILFGMGPFITIILIIAVAFTWSQFSKKDLKSNKVDIPVQQDAIGEKHEAGQCEPLHNVENREENESNAPETQPIRDLGEKMNEVEGNTNNRKNNDDVVKEPDKKEAFDVYKYAIMCNAYLEHQDEMERYENSD